MNGIHMNMFTMNSKSSLNSELSTTESCSPVPLRQTEQPNFPKWICDFKKECIKICGTRCSEKLDELMELYIKEVKKEIVLCASSPNRASLIVGRMSKTMMFFYLYYLDIKEFFVITQWNEHMVELLSLYCQLELKAALRVQRGKDSDGIISSRIMYALWIYLNNNEEHIINVILKIPNFSKKHKEIFDPIFRKLLLNKRKKPLTELEYIRNLLAFKLWKRLYCKDEKKAISHLALTELRPPRSFNTNYGKYKFLPRSPPSSNIHNSLVTALFNLDIIITDYFKYLDNKNKRSFESDYHQSEKKSFISDFCESFSIIDNNIEDLTFNINDNFTLDKIKKEVDNIDIEDDDVIIVEPEVVKSKPVIISDPTQIIDLTKDEPEAQINLETNEIPLWCKCLIKQSEKYKTVIPPLVEETEIEKEPESINRENVCNTPLDIDDSSLSEDNSIGLREITSTSHPVKDVASSGADSSASPVADSFPEQSPADVDVCVSTVNFEHVDSTSNINEEDCEPDIEAPTIKAFVVERTVEHTENGLVCSDVISEMTEDVLSETPDEQTSSIVSNVEFEQFASSQSVSVHPENLIIDTNTDKDSKVSDSVVCTSQEHISEQTDFALEEEYDDSLQIEVNLDNNNLGTQLENKNSENSTPTEIDEYKSPEIEPIAGVEYVDYVKGLDVTKYENFYKESNSKVINDAFLNRKRKNGEHVIRTYTKRVSKLEQPIEEPPEPVIPPPEEKERRVPLNGEKVFRFATEIWESVYTDTLKLSKMEYKLFNPKVVLKKENPKHYKPDYDDYSSMASEDLSSLIKPPSLDQPHHLLIFPSNAKKILERQDYLKPIKDEEKPRARVIKRPTPQNSLSLDQTTSKDKKLPDVVMQTKKRGTVSPDLNINLTLPKFESLSLNSSFQHHFCTDISACTSASTCFIPTSESFHIVPRCEPSSVCHPTVLTYVNNNSNQSVTFKQPTSSTKSCQIPTMSNTAAPEPVPTPAPILPAEIPYWHEIDSSSEPQKSDQLSQPSGPNLLVNINLDQCKSDHKIHLPIKKRRISSLKVEIKDELSYPATPMISIAELESIETERNKANVNNRPFKTPAELKEVPPLPASYMCNINPVPTHVITDNFNINHTYNTPTINYHVNNVPVINFQYNPHYQLPSIQPIILPVSRAPNSNWEQPPSYGYVKVPTAGKSESTSGKKRYAHPTSRTAERTKETVSKNSRTIQKNKSFKSKKNLIY